MRIPAAVALIALLAAPAFARPPGAVPPQEFDAEQPATQVIERPLPPPPVVQHRSPGLGVTLALLGTLGSYALASRTAESDNVLTGFALIVIGPSIGQWYSNQIGGLGITMRLAAGYLILRAFQDYESEASTGDDADLYILGGLGLWLGSTIYDLWAAYDAADTYNREHSLRFAPTVMPAASGAAPGVAASLRF